MTEPNFCGKIPFCPNLGRKGPKIGYFTFFEHVIWLSQKQCKMKILLKIFDVSLPTSYLTKFLFWSKKPKCSWPVRLQDSLKCNISRKNWGIKLIFCLWINIKVSYKVVLSLMEGVARHVQSTKNKFAIPL